MDVQMQDATSTGVKSAPSAQMDAAKLEAIRKATLHSYKNKFLNLRDKFDKVNATNTEYTTTLANARKKELALQEEIDMLLDFLAEHGAHDPEIAKCLNNPPNIVNTSSASSTHHLGQNGS